MNIFGNVISVRKFTNGDIEIDFQHGDEISLFRYSLESSKSNFPKELAETLISCLNYGICAEIFFDEKGIPTHIQLEECGDDSDEEDYDDELLADV